MLKWRVLQVTESWALPIATFWWHFFIWQKYWPELRAEWEKLRSNGMLWLCKKRQEETRMYITCFCSVRSTVQCSYVIFNPLCVKGQTLAILFTLAKAPELNRTKVAVWVHQFSPSQYSDMQSFVSNKTTLALNSNVSTDGVRNLLSLCCL
jgi:hypothetical protein